MEVDTLNQMVSSGHVGCLILMDSDLQLKHLLNELDICNNNSISSFNILITLASTMWEASLLFYALSLCVLLCKRHKRTWHNNQESLQLRKVPGQCSHSEINLGGFEIQMNLRLYLAEGQLYLNQVNIQHLCFR